MLRRSCLSFILILSFALTQMGALTHAFSHLPHAPFSSLPDKHVADKDCVQCVAYTQGAHGAIKADFSFFAVAAAFSVWEFFAEKAVYFSPYFYASRAPPL